MTKDFTLPSNSSLPHETLFRQEGCPQYGRNIARLPYPARICIPRKRFLESPRVQQSFWTEAWSRRSSCSCLGAAAAAAGRKGRFLARLRFPDPGQILRAPSRSPLFQVTAENLPKWVSAQDLKLLRLCPEDLPKSPEIRNEF